MTQSKINRGAILANREFTLMSYNCFLVNIMSKITINDITMYYIFVGMLFVSLVLSTNGSEEREETGR